MSAPLVKYARFAAGLRRFLRFRMSLEEARAKVRERLARRNEAFLHVMRRGIFDHPPSPYRPLLKRADCEFGDLERLVHDRGVEGALGALHDAGVYVTFEEFKGRKPIVRDGLEVRARASDFDSPGLRHYYEASTSGSTGAGTRVAVDLDYIVEQAPMKIVSRDAVGLLRPPTVLWRSILPSVTGLKNVLEGPMIGNVPQKWFTPLRSGEVRVPPMHQVTTNYILAVGRLCGYAFPWPEVARLDRPEVVLRCVERALKRHGACAVRAFPSVAMRVALAAREHGVDLTGAVLSGGGEPPSDAKVKTITDTGARWVANYGTTETGLIGTGCAKPLTGNDCHVIQDCCALTQRERQVPGWGVSVGAFYVTTLTPSAPKVMLNVELDDCGVLERRACGCPLDEIGYHLHVRDIRSYTKLTGEGVTLLNTDMVPILEEVLPQRFGGSPLDYQLLEDEDERGFTRLTLLVHPRLRLPAERVVVDAILEALRRGTTGETFAAAFWEQAKSLRLRRTAPLLSAGGKFLPLCVAQRYRARATEG
jgi:hypothetical protein